MKWTTVSANWQPAGGSKVDRLEMAQLSQLSHPSHPSQMSASGLAEEAESLTISCHENEIPPFIDFAMDRLYGSIFSSLKQFRIYHATGPGTHTYIVRRGMKIDTVFLFRCDGGIVRVLNEVIKLDSEQIDQFANYIFHRFRKANVIFFKSIQTEMRRFSYPFQRFNFSEDIVLSLPDSAEEYHSRLGKNTRRNIKRYGDKLKRSFPSYSFQTYDQSDVNEQHVRDIVALNHARMAEKNKTSMIDEEETQRIIALVKKCGLVGVVTIDGKVCAGTIGFWVGEQFYLSVVAHDPAYDEFWLGILCCYSTICECIAQHAKEFHFLWGRYEYKFTLLAVQRDLDMLVLYRSPLQVLLHAGIYARTAIDGLKRRLDLWLHDAAHHDTPMARLAVAFLNRLRTAKRAMQCLLSAKKSQLRPVEKQVAKGTARQ